MTITEIIELRKQRAAIVAKAGELLSKAHAEKRAITPEENQEWEKRHADADAIEAQINREERQMRAEAELRQSLPTQAGQADTRGNHNGASENGDAKTESAKRSKWFNTWLRSGIGALNDDGRRYMEGQYAAETRDTLTGQTTTTTAGGYTVAPDISLYSQLEIALLKYTWFEDAGCTMYTTATGADMPMPTVNDTSNTGELLTENTQAAQQALTFGQVTLKAYMFSSKIVLVSFQLLQDSAINVDATVGDLLGVRIGRSLATHMTTGTNSSQPQGIVAGATLGTSTGYATTVAFTDLMELKHSVDPAYRRGPSVRWMFNDSSLKTMKKLVDNYGRPIWQPGFSGYGRNVAEDNIDGDKYVINQAMASMTAGAKSILYGDFAKFAIRRVQGFQLLRLTERYADYLSVGFLGFARYDSKIIDAGTHPIKYLAQGTC